MCVLADLFEPCRKHRPCDSTKRFCKTPRGALKARPQRAADSKVLFESGCSRGPVFLPPPRRQGVVWAQRLKPGEVKPCQASAHRQRTEAEAEHTGNPPLVALSFFSKVASRWFQLSQPFSDSANLPPHHKGMRVIARPPQRLPRKEVPNLALLKLPS